MKFQSKENELTEEGIAKVCHEANRAYSEELEDDQSGAEWEKVSEYIRESCLEGVRFRLSLNPGAPAAASHENWIAARLQDGWMVGPVKDEEEKTHPNLVPFKDLPLSQQYKDHLFKAIVNTLAPLLTS